MKFTDTYLLDWIEEHHAKFRRIHDAQHGGPTQESLAFRRGMRIELFTVASQHVYGTDLRNAINVAIKKVEVSA